ncbi:MAG: hypothetical protein ACQERB_09975 [Promethearchaeati archaeon]
MPYLVKGGKFVYGWSKINDDSEIKIPDEALRDYNLYNAKKIIFIPGSKKSGGMGITTAEKLKNSKLRQILNSNNHKQKEDQTDRIILNTHINPEGYIKIEKSILDHYGLRKGELLLLVRGSHLALGMIKKGPIYEEAKTHPEIALFE